MFDRVHFIVEGEPRPKQSTRFDGNGRAHTDPSIKAWQNHVGWRAREAMQGENPMAGPVSVRLIFHLGDKRVVDCDNLSKSVLDGMRGIVFVDDSQVADLHITKRVDMIPGVLISVFPGESLP